METEIKLGFKDAESMFAITSADWFSDFCLDTSEKESVLLTNKYLDTADRKITSRGAMIRIRHYTSDEEDFYEFTVKYGGAVSEGLHQRYEWNVRSDNSNFNIAEFKKEARSEDDPDELLEEALEGVTDDDLSVICSNFFDRTVYMFGFGDSIMEACFDKGKILNSNNEQAEDILELELELKSGDVVDLKEMANYIIEETGCVPFNESKYIRTINLIDKG
ncbi:MAG: CYTH domain-containing protein [Saccharofermentans sp.]|nr:CYTH domain-containing protein [Saccharofermentans sp.]